MLWGIAKQRIVLLLESETFLCCELVTSSEFTVVALCIELPIRPSIRPLRPILTRFRNIVGFLLRNPIPPKFGGCSRWTRWPMLGSAGTFYRKP